MLRIHWSTWTDNCTILSWFHNRTVQVQTAGCGLDWILNHDCQKLSRSSIAHDIGQSLIMIWWFIPNFFFTENCLETARNASWPYNVYSNIATVRSLSVNMFSTEQLRRRATEASAKNAVKENSTQEKYVSAKISGTKMLHKVGLKKVTFVFSWPLILFCNFFRCLSTAFFTLIFSHFLFYYFDIAVRKQRQEIWHSQPDRKEAWWIASWERRDQTPCTRRQQKKHWSLSNRWV